MNLTRLATAGRCDRAVSVLKLVGLNDADGSICDGRAPEERSLICAERGWGPRTAALTARPVGRSVSWPSGGEPDRAQDQSHDAQRQPSEIAAERPVDMAASG